MTLFMYLLHIIISALIFLSTPHMWYNENMDKQLIFIDDSGDPGFKKGASSSIFVMTGAIFINSEVATLVNDAISEYRRSLGWKDGHEFKFRTTAKEIKLRVKTYIRQELNTKDYKKVEDFDVRDSRRDNLIQLADIVAGSINRSLQTDKTDSEEYIRIIRNKIIKLKLLNLGEK